MRIAEVRSHGQGCPPAETVIAASVDDSAVIDWHIARSVNNIVSEDLE